MVTNPPLLLNNNNLLWNSDLEYFEVQRTPTIWAYKEVNTAGRAVLQQVDPNYKFRLMGVSVSFGSSTLAALGRAQVSIYDGANRIIAFNAALNTVAQPCVPHFHVNFPGNGYLGADGQDIEIDLSTNLAAGQIAVTGWGCFEVTV